jgi:uncharacterized protein (DUF111 family)
MKVLYLENQTGITSGKLLGALSELCDQNDFIAYMNAAGIPGIVFCAEPWKINDICGTVVQVTSFDEEVHHHTSLEEIEQIVSSLQIEEIEKQNVLEVYHLLGEAESHVHRLPLSEIHFHEVGRKADIAKTVGCCVLMHRIHPDKVFAGCTALGKGKVVCDHGTLCIPAPATADLLQGIPVTAGNGEGELTTPTGAALLKHYVSSYEGMPAMITEKIGYGMEKKDTKNFFRVFLGTIEKGKI